VEAGESSFEKETFFVMLAVLAQPVSGRRVQMQYLDCPA